MSCDKGKPPHHRSDQIPLDKKITIVKEGANICLHLFSFLNFCRYIV